MADLIFTNLIQIQAEEVGKKIIPSLIFANITYTLNKQITTGTYEFFGEYNNDASLGIRQEIIDIVDKSFIAIGRGECFSLYQFLTTGHIQYARIVVDPNVAFNEFRFSDNSVSRDINGATGGKTGVTLVDSPDSNLVPPQENGASLNSILNFYSAYYKATHYRSRLYFYLLRPSLDNERIDGMLYFASKCIINDSLLRQISYLLSEELTRRVFDKVDRESVKSAIASIMSRNMSHNLGSHYLYYTKTHLEKLASTVSNQFSPDIRGAAKVLGYMQARMDYLATIISNDKYPYGCVNFKSQIYDELTVDDFSKRHFESSKYFNRTTNFLLSNLVLSEDFTRKSVIDDSQSVNVDLLSLRIKYKKEKSSTYRLFTGTNLDSSQVGDNRSMTSEGLDLLLGGGISPSVHSSVPTMSSEVAVKNDLSLLNIALPGGTMSCHAFYNVVENFIRNSAKYCRNDFHTKVENGKTLKDLTITIAISPHIIEHEEYDDRYIDFVVFDNKTNATRSTEYDCLYKQTKGLFDLSQQLGVVTTGFVETQSLSEIKQQVMELKNSITSFLNSNENNLSVRNLLSEIDTVWDHWSQPCLLEQMEKRLGDLKILDEHNAIDKESKGLKEMVFSSAWMRAYTYSGDKSFAETIVDIHNAPIGEIKLKLIREHCFEFVGVSDEDNSIKIFGRDEADKGFMRPLSLGIRFTLPAFRYKEVINDTADIEDIIKASLKVYADIVEIPKPNPTISRIYTRVAEGIQLSDREAYADVLKRRFGTDNDGVPIFEKYFLQFGTKSETDVAKKNRIIYFAQHLNAKPDELLAAKQYAYADSVSGGDYTKTMEELFLMGLDDTEHKERNEYYRMQIKESALTRITLIDERLQKSMESHKNAALELSLKNVRVLNYCDPVAITSIMDLFDGNNFFDINNEYLGRPNYSHFMSIHLGLIEKIIKSKAYCDMMVSVFDGKRPIIGSVNGSILSIKGKDNSTRTYILNEHGSIRCGDLHYEDRARLLMELLRIEMGGEGVYITVHSGRGNFSKELEGPLDIFPFISLSSLESAFNNSKMLLSQVFYNTRFVGKGIYNS